ncbi:flavodoxin family protein [candidate division KSB1 bacterium]|nr:flavodoxin family protein [candidate division KSB1 bacterium]
MKILILDGCNKSGIDNISELLPAESKVIHIRLDEKIILNCTGCKSCVWNMEKMDPGICILNDDMQSISPTFIQSDLVILISDIIFGGFSFQLKKVIDRLISALFTAPLKKRGEDVGHIMRYKTRPGLIGIGILTEKDERSAEVFTELFDRMSTLWDVPYHDSLVCTLNGNLEANRQFIKEKVQTWVEAFK